MNKKKLLALLMALVMTLTLVPVTALAEVVDSTSDDAVAEVGGTYYSDLQEAIAVAMKSTEESNKTVNLLKNVTVDTWYQNVFATSHTTDGTKTNYVEREHNVFGAIIGPNGITIDGKNYTLTVNEILSNGNGNLLFAFAENLTVRNLTIAAPNGINIKSGIIENVTFNMTNGCAIQTSVNDDSSSIEIKGCTFYTTTASPLLYYGILSDGSNTDTKTGIIISENTFNTPRSVVLRNDMQFLRNVVNSVDGVTIDSNFTGLVEGNYFKGNTSRSMKIYSAPYAVIRENVILGPIALDNKEFSKPQDLSGNYWGGGAPTTVEGKTFSNSYYDTADIYEERHADGTLFALSNSNAYVAQIGGVKYTTLEAAFAAAQDGETITLLANCAGNGIKAPQGKFTNGLTVNFAGFTYTVDGDTVGSTGTETNGFQLLKDNKITFMNGTITSAKAKILIQNYSNLTLEGMTLTLDNPNYTGAYTLSNNNGNVVIDGSTINANPAGGFAFDVCRYSSYPSVNVTVTGNSTINGNVEISASGSDAKEGFGLTLTSGTMTGNIIMDATAAAAMDATPEKVTITKASGFDKAAPDGYKWDNDGNLVKVTYVAQIGEAKYETLEAAIAAANQMDTIPTVTLLKDTSFDKGTATNDNGRLAISKSMIIDGNGCTVETKGARGFGVGINATSNVDVTFRNITVINSNSGGRCIETRGNIAKLTLDTVTLKTPGGGQSQPLTIGGYQAATVPVVIKNSTIQTDDEGKTDYAIMTFNPVNMTIEDSIIKGWACIYIKGKVSSAGSSGSTFTIVGSHLTSVNGAGPHPSNSFGAFKIEDVNIAVTVDDTTIDVTGNNNAQSIVCYQNGALKTASVTLRTGTIVDFKDPNAKFVINQNSFSITGGIYSKEPAAAYIADGYKAVKLTSGDYEGWYQVGVADIVATTEGTTADAQVTYTVNSVVKESEAEDAQEIESTTDLNVTVTGNTVESVKEDGSGVAVASLSNIKDNETLSDIVADAIEAAGSSITSTTSEANIVIQLAKSAPDTRTQGKVTYEVHPEAVITVAGSNESSTVALSNNQLNGSFSFTLDVSALGVANGDKVKVTHKHGGSSTELGEYLVEGGKITISGIESFSEFEVTTVDEYEGTVTLKFEGTGLRRRVRLNASVESNEVVRSSTDARFGFSWTLPGGYSVEQNSSYFRWSRDGVNWKEVPMAKNYNYTANLVITGIPSDAFNTPIYTELTLAYRDTNSTLKTITLSANARSVVDVANSLKSLTPNDDNNKWIDYAKYLLCDGINSYSIIDDGNGYDAQ